ncbi:MAG: hypothetical protein GY906_26520, partial [bacterium]|nr:hypothetical protein [bacterium]
SQGQIFAIGHSTAESKHYIYQLSTLAEEPTTPGNPVSPVIMPATYDVADPVKFSGAPWYNRRYYVADVAGVHGMVEFNGDTGIATLPLYTLGTGPAAALRPIKLFAHQNHMIALGYGDENTPYVADLLRSSAIGDPTDWPVVDFFNIGNSEEPLVNGISVGDFAILFKEFKIFRMAGSGAINWSFTEIDPDRGGVNTRCATYYEDFVWFLSGEGFARIGVNGPSELIVDKVKLSFADFDNLENCWVSANLPERMVVFACHEVGDAGTFPTLLVQVDTRTGNWTVRDYLASGPVEYESFSAARIPQVDAVASALGPQGPPIIQPQTLETAVGWTSNWINGDIRPLTTTRHESRNVDQGDPFVQDASEPFGVTTSLIVGKESGAVYEERVRHERNGIFSDYSPDPGTQQVLTLPLPPVLTIIGYSAANIQLRVDNPNEPGVGSIPIEMALGGMSGCPIPGPTYNLVTSITNPLATQVVYIGGIICDTSYQFRAFWFRATPFFGPSADSNEPCIVHACVGGP